MGRTRKNVFVILSLTLLFVLYNSNIMVSAYRWPRQNADGLYRINATYGEFRQSYSDLSALTVSNDHNDIPINIHRFLLTFACKKDLKISTKKILLLPA
jgi:hypothetical protein